MSPNQPAEVMELVRSQEDAFSKRDKPNSNPYETKPGEKSYKLEIVWQNVIMLAIFHLTGFYGFFVTAKAGTWFIATVWLFFSGWGTTAGAHRLWSHRSYKANKKLKLILIIFQTISIQAHIIKWVRDHRVHHKFSDTNADPHNITRGFFFSHMGWLMCKKHPDVVKYGSKIDLTDLTSDPWLMFQQKYYLLLFPFFSLLLPMQLSVYFFEENFYTALFPNMLRYIISLHLTFSINSVAHSWGLKPYEKGMTPTDNPIVGFFAVGEGWHNYHHVFPWDYKGSEFLKYYNLASLFISFFAWLGWATDLKTTSPEIIRKRVMRTGDGSHRYAKALEKSFDTTESRDVDHFWGFNDDDMLDEDNQIVKVLYPKHHVKHEVKRS